MSDNPFKGWSPPSFKTDGNAPASPIIEDELPREEKRAGHPAPRQQIQQVEFDTTSFKEPPSNSDFSKQEYKILYDAMVNYMGAMDYGQDAIRLLQKLERKIR